MSEMTPEGLRVGLYRYGVCRYCGAFDALRQHAPMCQGMLFASAWEADIAMWDETIQRAANAATELARKLAAAEARIEVKLQTAGNGELWLVYGLGGQVYVTSTQCRCSVCGTCWHGASGSLLRKKS